MSFAFKTRAELTAPSTTLTLSGLDGDKDETYFLKGEIFSASGLIITVEIFPNDDDVSPEPQPVLIVVGTNDQGYFQGWFWPIDGLGGVRNVRIIEAHANFPVTTLVQNDFTGAYIPTGNITSLVFRPQAGREMDAGSYIDLYTLRTTIP